MHINAMSESNLIQLPILLKHLSHGLGNGFILKSNTGKIFFHMLNY